jgi:hypothetical protein
MVQSQYAILSPALHVDLAKATPEDLLDLLGDNPADYIKDNDSEPAMGFADFGAVDEKEEAKKILGFYLATFHADAPGVIVALRPKLVTAKSAASAFHSGAGAGIVMRDETSTEHPIANTTIAMLDEPTDVVKNWKNNYAARWQAHLADLRVKYPPADGASSTEKYNVSPLTLHDVFHVTLDRASTKKNLVTVEDSGRTTLDGDACKEYGIELQEQANILVASFLVRYPPESRRSEMKIPTISGGNKKLNELIKTRLEEHYPAVRVVESAAATAEKAKDAIPLADRMSILNRGSGAVPGSDSTTKSNRTGSVPVGTDSPLRSAGGERTSPVKSTEAADSTVPTGSQLRR